MQDVLELAVLYIQVHVYYLAYPFHLCVISTQVTEREFLEHLHELNQKINFVKEQSFKESRSEQDIQGVLEKLKFKVRLRVRSVIAIDVHSSL